MNAYEQRQAERLERRADRAARLTAMSESAFRHAHAQIEMIPLGQPILVGHHSERGHRAALARHDRWMRKAFDLKKAAAEAAWRAAHPSTAVSSDDPEAVAKLREKLAKLERQQEAMKAGNKIVRSKIPDDEKVAQLMTLGLREETARGALQPDFAGRYGFPDYALTNNNANIRRIRERIATLERSTEARPDIEGPAGCTISEDTSDNRLLIVFAGKPPQPVRAILKRCGFRWSPTRGAWCRMLNNAARHSARFVVELLEREQGSVQA